MQTRTRTDLQIQHPVRIVEFEPEAQGVGHFEEMDLRPSSLSGLYVRGTENWSV